LKNEEEFEEDLLQFEQEIEERPYTGAVD